MGYINRSTLFPEDRWRNPYVYSAVMLWQLLAQDEDLLEGPESNRSLMLLLFTFIVKHKLWSAERLIQFQLHQIKSINHQLHWHCGTSLLKTFKNCLYICQEMWAWVVFLKGTARTNGSVVISLSPFTSTGLAIVSERLSYQTRILSYQR